MNYERDVLSLRIRLVMEGAAWSITYGDALAYSAGMALGLEPNLDRYAKRAYRHWNAHDAYRCHSQRCFHPLDWTKDDWVDFRREIKEQIRLRKKENVAGSRGGRTIFEIKK